jgi:FkbH-like protein
VAADLRCLLIADFNAANLAGLLENDGEPPRVEPLEPASGPVVAPLADANHDAWREKPELVVIWTRPEATIASFQRLIAQSAVEPGQLLAEVDAYAGLIRGAAQRARWVLPVSWTLSPDLSGAGLGDWQPGRGLAHAVAAMNLRLADALDGSPNVHMLDAQRWVGAAGPDAFSPRLWYQGKIPFGHAVFEEAVRDIKAALRGLTGRSRKLIALDLDETLWGGIVGDVGWEGLRLGGHDAAGEAYVDFQEALKALTRRGVVLAIVSKNDEAVALEAIRRHPEMRLRLEDFAGWRISWDDKAKALEDLAAEVNLGLDAVVFIDDNPVERARIRESLPEVLVPEWPRHPMLYRHALASLRCFDQPALSDEDHSRTASYVAERERTGLRQRAGSAQEWLAGLGMTVTVERLDAGNLSRATQLLNKTNQMNLATRRMSDAELEAWASQPGRSVWAFRVSDRFGDSGLTGLASLQVAGERAQIVDFVLSCRVMGRHVEEVMTHWLVDRATRAGASETWAQYLPTAKNRPCLEFWKRSGFEEGQALRFAWRGAGGYAKPAFIQLHAAPETGGR